MIEDMPTVKPFPNVAYYNGYNYSSIQRLHHIGNMHGVKRVILFCIMTTVLPTLLIIIPLYLRHNTFADVIYPVAESDVLEIMDGISSIFCHAQTLQMNTTFNAFQVPHTPEISTKRKHIRLMKSMVLPDDTLEYWGFYLLKEATVSLKVCSRYRGSQILVVRGERNLRTCGLLEHNLNKLGAQLDKEHSQVKVIFEHAQEIDSTNVESSNFTEDAENVNAAVEDENDIDFDVAQNSTEKSSLRHQNSKRRRNTQYFEKIKKLEKELNEEVNSNANFLRSKRNVGHTLDRHIQHGGNAINFKNESGESSASSFEAALLTCYNGQILLTQNFPPSDLCTDVHYLENRNHMETVHNVISDGYYYYIFYSDNDLNNNDIHAIFDIYKPTFEFANISTAKSCIKSTKCEFSIPFWSDETVIVEVPTRDGIGDKGDDISLLISTCEPRMSVYVIFPIAVMFLILGCAFL